MPDAESPPVAEPARMATGRYARWAILNSNLRLSHIRDDAGSQHDPDDFALSVDGYEYRGSMDLGPQANDISSRLKKDIPQ